MQVAEKESFVPDKSFKELKLEMFELELSSLGRRLTPYQSCLIHYWREEYIQLLDVDTFAAAIDSWERRGSEVTIDLFAFFDDTRNFYLRDLVTLIQNTDLALQEKEFLELFLINILNQGEISYRRAYELNFLADSYLSKYPDSPFRQFVQSYIQVDIPPLLWSYGFSYIATIPKGSISEYFTGRLGIVLDLPVSYGNVLVTPSISWAYGYVKTAFSYDGEYWSGECVWETLDLSLGYRVRLLQDVTVLPQGGLGIMKIWEIFKDEGVEFSFTPTVSLGIVIEFIDQSMEYSFLRWTFGVTYRRLIHPWDDRFEGSELVLSLGGARSFSF